MDFVASPWLELGAVPIPEPMGYADCLKLLDFKPGTPSKDSDFIALGGGSHALVF